MLVTLQLCLHAGEFISIKSGDEETVFTDILKQLEFIRSVCWFCFSHLFLLSPVKLLSSFHVFF